MSDTSQGQGWWLASDGRWYAPELHPTYLATLPPPVMTVPVGPLVSSAGVPYPPGYGPPPGAVGAVSTLARMDSTVGTALAPWWKRLVAFIIDVAVMAVPYFIVAAIIAAATSHAVTYSNGTPGTTPSSTPFVGEAIGVFFGVLIVSIPYLVYAAAMNGSSRGQTLGKMAMQIAVRDSRTGGPIGFWRGVGRYLITYLFWGVFVLPGLLEGLWPLWDGRRQAWHDKVAHTVVVERPA